MINSDSIASASIIGLFACAGDVVIEWLGNTQHVWFSGCIILIAIGIVNSVISHKYKLLVYRAKQMELMVKNNISTKKELEEILEIEPFHKEARSYIKKLVSRNNVK